MTIKIAPSILAADFANLAAEVRKVEQAGADMLHVDVMDGHFVPNISIGVPVVESLRKITRMPLDCHLMIENPEQYIPAFLDAGADSVTFHAEAVALPQARKRIDRGWTIQFLSTQLIDFARAHMIIDMVRSRKKKVAIAINPDTMIEVLEGLPSMVDMVLIMTVWPGFGGQQFMENCLPKVQKLRELNKTVDIQVDGGLNPTTVAQAAQAGANVIVAGTATFRSPNPRAAVEELRSKAKNAYTVR